MKLKMLSSGEDLCLFLQYGNKESYCPEATAFSFFIVLLIEQSCFSASVVLLAQGLGSSCMPIVHCLHIVCFLYLFLLLDLWRLSAIPEDPARRQKLCFSQSCFSLKQEGPLQKPSLQ